MFIPDAKTADSGLSSVLREVGSNVITTNQCQQEAGQSFSGDKIICADGSKGHRYCYVNSIIELDCCSSVKTMDY